MTLSGQCQTLSLGTHSRRHTQAHPALPTVERPKAVDTTEAAAAIPFRWGGAHLHFGDSLDLAVFWPTPTVIVSDGHYGLGSFPGDPTSSADLPVWYEPHVRLWAAKALPETTL